MNDRAIYRGFGCPAVTAAVLLCAGAGLGAANPATPPDLGRYLGVLSGLADPAAVAIVDHNTIYIADSGNHCIRRGDAAGKLHDCLGGYGDAPGQFHAPGGLALTPDHRRLVVADTGNHRIQVLETDGTAVAVWGGYGAEAGQFNRPRGVAAAGERLYVADTGNARVQVFDLQGRWVRTLGSYGSGDGQFKQPVDVTVDTDGFCYVVDADLDCVQKFDAGGRLVARWGERGSFPGLLAGPSGVASAGGAVFVADGKNQRVQAFDTAGQVLYQWGSHAIEPRAGSGQFHYPSALAVSPDGTLAVVCEDLEDRCQIFGDLQGAPRPRPEFFPPGGITHFGPRAATAGDLLLIREPDAYTIQVFKLREREPVAITQFGGYGTALGRLVDPRGMVIDARTWRVLVGDSGNRRLQTFALAYHPTGRLRFVPNMARFVKSFNLAASTPPGRPGLRVSALQYDAAGNLYALDREAAEIVVLDQALKVRSRIGGFGGGPGRLRDPTDLALSRDGRTLFVVDAGRQQVLAFDLQGRPLFAWGGRGSQPGSFQRPFGIAAGKDGCVYVSDTAAARVQKFDERGRLLAHWGTAGLGAGEFHKPYGVVQDDQLRIIVIDFGNHRAQIFDADGHFIHAFGSRFYTGPANRAAAAKEPS